jgi:1-acyl-sn-glycerol-3-phosphate acyltransferase
LPELPGVVKLAHAYNVPLVPVYFGGEQDLCWVWKNEPALIRWMRLQTYGWIGLYFPLVFCPRVWNMPTLHTRMGPVIENPQAMASAADLAAALKKAEHALVTVSD